MQRNFKFLPFLLIALGSTPLLASASSDHASAHASHVTAKPVAVVQTANTGKSTPAENSAAMTEGEIKKVDKNAGKITIKHAELKNLDMPPMTMAFQVKDKAMLDQVKVGDKINFVAGKVNGKLTVVQIDTQK